MNFTAATIEEYHRNKNLRHIYYKDTVKSYEDLKVHYYDDYPSTLIEERRPGESDKIKEYRKKISVSITNDILWGVFTTLNKIRKAKDYGAKYKEVPAIINKDETPEKYLDEKLPIHESITNWAFSSLLIQYGLDANAVVLTFHDITKPIEGNEYLKPFPTIFNSDCVLDYKEDEFYILKAKEINYFDAGKKGKGAGAVYYTVTTDTIQRFVQTSYAGDLVESHIYSHTLGRLPITNLQGVIIEDNKQNRLSRSRLSPMVPRLKEIYREYSDIQAEVIQHIHSTMWAYEAQECKICKGTGMMPSLDKDKKAVSIECHKCSGKGTVPINPYEILTVRPSEAGANPAPTPPMGYVSKDTSIITIQDKRINDHRFFCLASIHMQNTFTQLNQSGTAKEWDNEPQNNFVHSIAEDIIRIKESVCMDIIDLRYQFIKDENKRKDLCPIFSVPDKFDLVGTNDMLDEFKQLKDSGADASILSAAMVSLSEKMFSQMPEIKNKLVLKAELDPLSGMGDDSILAAGDNISKEDLYIHYNINSLIDDLTEATPDFMNIDIITKREMLDKIAADEIAKIKEDRMQSVVDAQKSISFGITKVKQNDPMSPNMPMNG